MPTRILRDWTDSESINQLSAEAERLFVRIIMKADDYGRLTANPKLLRPLLYPLLLEQVREADIQRWIAECVKAGLVRLYSAAGGHTGTLKPCDRDQPGTPEPLAGEGRPAPSRIAGDSRPGPSPLSKEYMAVVNFGQRMRNSRSKYPAPPGEVSPHPAADGGDPPRLAAEGGGARPDAESDSEAEKPPNSPEPGELPPREGAGTMTRFQKPSPGEVTAYAASLGYKLDGEKFCAFYESKGWRIGRSPMKSWKAAVVTWKKGDEERGRNGRQEADRVKGTAGYVPGKYSHLG